MRMIERVSPLLAVLHAVFAAMGAAFLWQAMTGGVPMPPHTHGSAMYIIPAEAWSLAVIAAHGAGLWGAASGRLGWTMIAGAGGGLVYLALGLLSWSAEYGDVVTGGGLALGLVHCWIFGMAAADMRLCRLWAQIERAARHIRTEG